MYKSINPNQNELISQYNLTEIHTNNKTLYPAFDKIGRNSAEGL